MESHQIANRSVTNAFTIPEMLERRAQAHPRSPALIIPGSSEISYSDLFASVMRFAGRLHALGLGNLRVGIALPNGAKMSIALLGSATTGVGVPFNPASTKSEFVKNFGSTGVRALVTDSNLVPQAIEAARELDLLVLGLEDVSPLFDFSLPSPSDTAVVLLTSGTTGQSKAVPLTHRNLLAGATAVVASLSLSEEDRALSMWELHHVGGVVDLLLAPLSSGGSVISAGGFDAKAFFQLASNQHPTWFQGVPTSFAELLKHSLNQRKRPESLRFLRSVASALPHDRLQELEQTFGVPVITTFGMTEASPLITSTKLPPVACKPGSVGQPCGAELAVLSPEGDRLEEGEVGELAVRGANVFEGYENDPDTNAKVMRDGWFITGDLGYIDADGDLFLTGRAKDIINRGGEKIAPREIEEVVAAHPAVAEAAVFAIPHRTLGEEIAISVVPKAGRAVTLRDIKRHTRERLAAFKTPKRLLMLDKLPRNAVGKVVRTELLKLLENQNTTVLVDRGATSPLEAAIADLWADELDCDFVGLDDDYTDLGGDSLVSIRLILAVERMTGIKLPDDAIDQLDTVRQMAALLLTMGARPKPPFRKNNEQVKRDQKLDKINDIAFGCDPFPKDILQRCRTELELETVRHALETVSPPKELSEGLAFRLPKASKGFVAAITASGRLNRRRHHLLASVNREMQSAKDPFDWRRRRIGENVNIYSNPKVPANCKTLVVGFSGRAMRLTAPVYQVLCALDPASHDLLLLRDPVRRHYFTGVPELGGTIEAVALWLQAFRDSEGYGRVVALGTSAGGIPSICVAILNDWPRVLAVGADEPSRHPHFDEVLMLCRESLEKGCPTKVVIAFSGKKKRDASAANDLSDILLKTQMIGDNRFDSHPLLYLLHEKGELATFLATRLLCENSL